MHEQPWVSMSPEERDRMTRLEEAVKGLNESDVRMEKKVDRIDEKVDSLNAKFDQLQTQILVTSAIGKGALWTVGKVLVFVTACAGGAAWLIDFLTSKHS